MPDNLQICYFPYIFLKGIEEVIFDKISVWNYDLLASKRIKDDNLRKYLNILLAANKRNGKPIKDIGIIAFGDNYYFRPLADKERRSFRVWSGYPQPVVVEGHNGKAAAPTSLMGDPFSQPPS